MEALILKTLDSGDQKIVARFTLENGRVVCDSEKWYELLKNGIMGEGGKQIRYRDGAKFLQTLPVEFSGSRLRATFNP